MNVGVRDGSSDVMRAVTCMPMMHKELKARIFANEILEAGVDEVTV